MDTLSIMVCENQAPEVEEIVRQLDFDNVKTEPYPCTCLIRENRRPAEELLLRLADEGGHIVLFCSHNCDLLKTAADHPQVEIIKKRSCFQPLISSEREKYIVDQGGFLITLGWLRQWRANLQNMGFDRSTARRFYQETTDTLIFLDSDIEPQAKEEMEKLSRYLEVPYGVTRVDLDALQHLIGNIAYKWRFQRLTEQTARDVERIRSRFAQYAAVLDMTGHIARCTDRRHVVEQVKMLFTTIMGARRFAFHGRHNLKDNVPQPMVAALMADEDHTVLLPEENRLYMAIMQQGSLYGVLEAGDFLFPEHMARYVSFARGIAHVSAMALLNVERFEQLQAKTDELEYKSNHDAITGLRNRRFFNDYTAVIGDQVDDLCVFSLDIDGLKSTNDEFGHLEGDKLIAAVGDLLRRCFRETDVLARTGGDEFMAVVPDCKRRTAQALAERIIAAVGDHNQSVSQDHLRLSLSVGYVVGPDDGNTIEKLIRQADLNMYRHKRSKNRVSTNTGQRRSDQQGGNNNEGSDQP